MLPPADLLQGLRPALRPSSAGALLCPLLYDGSIYAPADGRVRGALFVQDPRTGRDIRKLVYGKTRADVSRKLAKLREVNAAGALPSTTTVADFLAGWLEGEQARLRLGTGPQRELHIRLHIVPALGSVAVSCLTPADVERMTSRVMEGGLSPRTAAHVRVTLRRALGDAQRDGLAGRNVASLARPPRVPSRSMEAGRDHLTPAQLKTLLEGVKEHPLGSLITVAATTGLRQGELLGLGWADVNLEARTLAVRHALSRAWIIRNGEWTQGWALQVPKTPKSRRTIHLPVVAIAALKRARTTQDAHREAAGTAWQDRAGLVFTDVIGRPLHPSMVSHTFPDTLKTPGLPPVPFHGLRHSAATSWLAAGVPLRTVADQLGHSTKSPSRRTPMPPWCRISGVTPPTPRTESRTVNRTLRRRPVPAETYELRRRRIQPHSWFDTPTTLSYY